MLSKGRRVGDSDTVAGVSRGGFESPPSRDDRQHHPRPVRSDQCGAAIEFCQKADALVIPTPWRDFRAVDLKALRAAMTGNIILDPFGLLDGAKAVALGFDYYRLGAPPLESTLQRASRTS